jgi:hypothetical protein
MATVRAFVHAAPYCTSPGPSHIDDDQSLENGGGRINTLFNARG